jgi:hypothetical protein
MIHLYHSTSQISREVFLSDEIKSGYAKFPNWLMDLVEKQKVSIVDAHFWVVINNVPSGFKYRRAALINKGHSKRQVDQAIDSLLALNLIKETKVNLKNVHYEAIDLQKECPKTGQTMSQNGTNYVPKRDTNKTISKNINNGENSPKENTPPTPIRGRLNIDHLFVQGKRRERLEDALKRMLGEFVPEFIPWLEKRCMTNKAMLPLRLDQKLHQTTLSNAKLFLGLRAMEKEYEKY